MSSPPNKPNLPARLPEPVPNRAAPAAGASAPDLSIEAESAGRDTLTAIAEELSGVARAASTGDTASGAGRATLSELADAIVDGPRPRRRRATVGYETRPLGAPAAERPTRQEPPPKSQRLPRAEQEVSIRVRPAGRETLAAIEQEVAAEAAEATAVGPGDAYEIFEMVTFVVRGGDLARLSSQSVRRQFVTERLLSRLPVDFVEDIDRVDVTPWTVRGTVIVRVWCRSRL